MSNRLRYKYAPDSERGGDWRDSAACLKEDPELFFPNGSSAAAKQQAKEAAAVCAGCEVIDTCLAHALKKGEDFGVWGGLTEDERRAIKRRNSRQQMLGQRSIQDGNG